MGNTGNPNFDPIDPMTGMPITANTTAAVPAPAPANPLDPNAGMAPMTGFASRYTPVMADQAYENPWYVLPDVFPGMKTSNPMFQALRDLGFDPLTLYNIMAGSQQEIDQGAGSYINWLENLYKNQATPGGQTLDATSLIRTLFGQEMPTAPTVGASGEVTSEGVPGNSLSNILGAGDMSTQVRTLFNMLREVSNGAMNPLAARGYQSAVAQAGDSYGNAQMKAASNEDGTASMSPTDWMKANTPWLTGR
jgi:hypothetical protein